MSGVATIVGLGEILWDVFPQGARFGGAPANFACSAAALGRGRVHVFVAGAVGRDTLGDRAIQRLRERGVDTSCVAQVDEPTGQVLVALDVAGHASYEFAPDAAWDNFSWSGSLHQLATRSDVVCFGTLGQRSSRSRETIRMFLSTTGPSALRILDVNLRLPFYDGDVILESLELANILKLSDMELPVLAALCDLKGSSTVAMQKLARRFDLQLVALTRGASGAVLVRGDQVSEHPGVPTEVVDTVGAGDAFTAALVLGLLEGHDLPAMNDYACRVAAFVCSQPGATPDIPGDLLQR